MEGPSFTVRLCRPTWLRVSGARIFWPDPMEICRRYSKAHLVSSKRYIRSSRPSYPGIYVKLERSRSELSQLSEREVSVCVRLGSLSKRHDSVGTESNVACCLVRVGIALNLRLKTKALAGINSQGCGTSGVMPVALGSIKGNVLLWRMGRVLRTLSLYRARVQCPRHGA